MKRLILLLCLVCMIHTVQGQNERLPAASLRWAPGGLLLGNLSFFGEYNFGKNSLTAKIGVPVTASRTLTYDGKEAHFTMKAMSFMTGYRTYLSKKHMQGFYYEPYVKYTHHVSEGIGTSVINGETVNMSFTNDFNAIGLGVQVGIQFLINKKVALDFFFLGPEINSARNNFKASDLSNSIAWTSVEAREAEHDIRRFIEDYPFIRKNVTYKADYENKFVSGSFKGPLPGYRIGVAIGVAF